MRGKPLRNAESTTAISSSWTWSLMGWTSALPRTLRTQGQLEHTAYNWQEPWIHKGVRTVPNTLDNGGNVAWVQAVPRAWTVPEQRFQRADSRLHTRIHHLHHHCSQKAFRRIRNYGGTVCEYEGRTLRVDTLAQNSPYCREIAQSTVRLIWRGLCWDHA